MEWKKIIVNRRLLVLLIALLVLQVIVFEEGCRKKDRLWQEQYGESYTQHLKEEQQQYQKEFQERIQGIVEQADSMEAISIFAKADSFASRNVRRTKEAFEPLGQVELAQTAGRTITELFAFRFGNVCTMLCALLIAFALSEITAGGVRCITFTTLHGKMRLALEKKGALLLWAFLLALLSQLTVFVEGILLFGENLLELLACPVQTFVCFGSFPWRMSTGLALVFYLLYRTAILYSIMILVWMICLLCNHAVLATGFCGVLMGIEYFLYKYIDDTHVLKLFKFCNVWYQAVENSYFTQYRNLDILGYAVDRNLVIVLSLLLADLAGSAVGIYISCTRYPRSTKSNALHKVIDGVKTRIDAFRGGFMERFSLAEAEIYKVLITQKGLVVIFLFGLLLVYRADFSQTQRSTQQELYYEFVNSYLGVPGTASEEEIEKWRNDLEQVDKTYEQRISEDSLSAEDAISLSIWYGSFEERRNFLEQIESQTESLKTIVQDSGIEVWYVNQHSYDHLMQDDDWMLNIGLLLVILWICIGMYIGEKGSGMLAVIRSCPCERTLYKTKRRIAAAVTTVVYLLVRLFEIILVAVVYEIRGLGAPVQSILKLSDIPFEITIWQYFLIRYAVKYLLSILICFLVCRTIENIVCKRGRENGIKNRKPI